MARSPFDVVVSNMHRPEMSGIELLDALWNDMRRLFVLSSIQIRQEDFL